MQEGTVRVEVKEEMKLDWMYKAATVEREDYLLGRSIDKAFDQLEKSASGKTDGDQESIPGSIFTNSSTVTQVDIARKVHEDPLFAIKKKEMETREQLLKNPRKLKQLHDMIKMQKMAVEKKEKQKKKKHKDGRDLDALLASKYKKLKDKLDLKNLKEIESSVSDSSSDCNARKTSKKHKKHKLKYTKSSETDSSDSEKDHIHKKSSNDKEKRNHSAREINKPSKYNSVESSDSSIDSVHRNTKNRKKQVKDKSPENVKSGFGRQSNRNQNNSSSYSREISGTDRETKRASEDKEKHKYSVKNRSSSYTDPENEKHRYKFTDLNDSQIYSKDRIKIQDKSNSTKWGKNSSRSRSCSKSDTERNNFMSRNTNYTRKEKKHKTTQNKRFSSRTRSSSISEDEKISSKRDKLKQKNTEENTRSRSKDLKKRNIKNDSDQEMSVKKIRVDKRKESNFEDSRKLETNKAKNKDIKKEHKNYSSTSSEYTSEEEGRTKKKAYGLVLPAGYVPKSQSHQKPIQEKVEDIKPWKKPKSTKLTEEEMNKRIAEMMHNAQWRDKERDRKIADHKSKEAKEKKDDSNYSTDFLRKQMLYAASQSTIEQRIKSNINNIQRNRGDMDKNFARR